MADVVTSIEEFWRAEAEYWQAQAERAQHRLDMAMRAATGETGYEQPPEPPVGTTFDTQYGRIERREDGWHCEQGCVQCPTEWWQVWEYEVSPYARRRYASRNGKPIPDVKRTVPS